MSIRLFVTGTDTGIGKTRVCAALLHGYRESGYSTIGLKPIASGAHIAAFKETVKDASKTCLVNEDALTLMNAATIKLPYQQINPFCFEPPIAPHIAAREKGITLSEQALHEKMKPALSHHADIHLIEGAGGWYLPLNDHETYADWVKANHFQVLLVVGIRLGCLNHTLLTHHAIVADKVPFAGWIANCIDPNMLACSETIEALTTWLKQPPLTIMRHQSTSIDITHMPRQLASLLAL